ncbi:hypothetical protein PUN28_012281 [Cardiocondyla obscurior]|uniref:Vitellogenin n=4 Tax=Cardiocondyla obscurior TaxID=286306 RepID=A0AAW2FED9_9HYME
MWFPVTLLLLVGVAVASHDHGWETQTEYRYVVRSRTLAGLDGLKQQYTGLQLKGVLTIQVKSPDTLLAKLSDTQYARIHKTLSDGPETKIPEQMLDYQPLSMSGKPFEIKLRHGVIRDLKVDRDVPMWELNVIKGFASQLQIDTQGENIIYRKSAQIPEDENSSLMYRAMEDSVGGLCEVMYEISPMTEDSREDMHQRISLPQSHNWKVKKTKNYERCQQRQIYHHNVNDPTKKSNKQDEIVSQLSTSKMIISGNLKRFTIQSAETKNVITVKTEPFNPTAYGTVYSTIKLTLVEKSNLSDSLSLAEKLEQSNLESTGNLVYAYNNPFSDTEGRKKLRPSTSLSSLERQSSSQSSDSSSQENNLSSGSSSSSSSSSEEQDTSKMQPKAPLRQAPNVPFLPFFIGNKGKAILKSDQFNPVERAQNIIAELAQCIKSTPNLSCGYSLENYVNLKNLLRTMNYEQFGELDDRVRHQKQGENEKDLAWAVLRDVVSQAATGPALLTVKDWLKNGQLKGLEAAQVISQIPKQVREPTEEYLKAFFEMIESSQVKDQEHVNTTAPLAFAALLHNSLDNNRYPKYSFGRMIPKNSEDVDRYISNLINQLREAFQEKNNEKIQTYIVALGITGSPKILSAFEPYLEGKEPATKFQRVLIVTALNTLGKLEPKLVKPIYFKLYANKNEDHEIRCIAVQQLILLNPSLITLQQIVEYTYMEQDPRVNSAVKTTIESIATSERPELRDLARKCNIVKSRLNSKIKNLPSVGYYQDVHSLNIKGLLLQTVSGDDSRIPAYARLGLNTASDLLRQPGMEIGYAVSSIRHFLDKITKRYQQRSNEELTKEESLQKSHIEKIARALNMRYEPQEQMEGIVYTNTPDSFMFYPFDDNTIEKASQMMKNFMKKENMKLDHFYNYEKTVSFPTENGLPFVYTSESPIFVQLRGEWKKESPERNQGVIKVFLSNHAQKRFGFVAPFEHQQYISGIDDKHVVNIPVEYEAKLNMQQRKLALKLRPSTRDVRSESEIFLLHKSTNPFTTRQDIFEMQPVALDKNTHQVLINRKQKTTIQNGMYSVKVESDVPEMEENSEKGVIGKLWQMHQHTNGLYKKVEGFLNAEQAAGAEIRIDVAYDNKDVNKVNKNEQQTFPPSSLKQNSENRREKIMNGLGKDLKSGKVHVIDINYNIPMSEVQHTVSIGSVKSDADRKSKAFVYWNSQSQSNEEKNSEAYYMQEMKHSPVTPLDFDFMMQNEPKKELKAELVFGKNLKEGTRFVLTVNATQSNQMRNAVQNSKIMKECWQEFEKENKVARVCQQAIELAQITDQYNISVDLPDTIRDLVNAMVESVLRIISNVFGHSEVLSQQIRSRSFDDLKDMMREIVEVVLRFFNKLRGNDNVEITSTKDLESKRLNLKVNMLPSNEPKMAMRTQRFLPHYMSMWRNIESQRQWNEHSMLQYTQEENSCTLDKDQIVTFDKQVYPIFLGPVQHVLMVSYNKETSEPHRHMSMTQSSMETAVLAEDSDDGNRIITSYLNGRVVVLRKSNNQLVATVNGKTVRVTESNTHAERDDNDKVVFEIYTLPGSSGDSLKLVSYTYDFSIVYNGRRVQIVASDRYRNAVRGLCGSYNSNPKTDFVTPSNCLLSKPEEFTATYALIKEDSRGPAVENKRKAEQAECRPLPSQKPWHRNIINDREAGRAWTENEMWGYHQNNIKKQQNRLRQNKKHNQEEGARPNDLERNNMIYRTRVVEEGGEICFTTRPIPACREDTKPTDRKSKKYDLYCEEKNDESVAKKNRIEDGANPDFTRKPVSRSHMFQVPIACSAA